MDEREQRKIRRRLAVLRHAEEVTGSVAATCRYYGGLIRRSPYRILIPHPGDWHAVVDLRGLSGTTTASASVIPRSAS